MSLQVPFSETPSTGDPATDGASVRHRIVGHALVVLLTLLLAAGTATAQSGNPGQAFCDTNMAGTIQNIFMVIQFGGPLIGGVLALGATVALPYVRRSDMKQELKAIRNQGLPPSVEATVENPPS